MLPTKFNNYDYLSAHVGILKESIQNPEFANIRKLGEIWIPPLNVHGMKWRTPLVYYKVEFFVKHKKDGFKAAYIEVSLGFGAGDKGGYKA